jgi:hypothetical protein
MIQTFQDRVRLQAKHLFTANLLSTVDCFLGERVAYFLLETRVEALHHMP